jgi:hypothetical protein
MAAGIGGAGQALARYGAAANTGDAQSQANQAAAMLRAKELQDARMAYGANAMAMQHGAAGMYGTASGQALGYGGLASGLDQFNLNRSDKIVGATAQGIGQAAGMYFGQPGGGSNGSNPNSGASPGGYTVQGNQLYDAGGNAQVYGTS